MPDSEALVAYTHRLRRLTEHVDPIASSPAADAIRDAAGSLEDLTTLDEASLVQWVSDNPDGVYTLGLAVGLSQEKLKNWLRSEFGTTSWRRAARTAPHNLVARMDQAFDLLTALDLQRGRTYTLGDVLVARGASRQTASSAGIAGRMIEDQVEAVVRSLGLPYEMRGRFVGVDSRTGPADLAIPNMANAVIAVGCKGFDSTGSKLTAAVSEITEMVDVHRPNQYLMAVVDGIGWHGRMGDFRRMFEHFESRRIEGLYTLADLFRFRLDVEDAARRARLL